MNLSGKLILISGAAGALGVVICNHLAKYGSRVIAIDMVSGSEARSRFAIAGDNLTYIECDVTDPDQVNRAYTEIVANIGVPDVVCCHAGMVEVQPIQDYELAAFDALMALNVRGAFILAQRATKEWLDRNLPGNLIFTTSWVHQVPWPEITPYAASKAALNAMMRGFAKELAEKSIRANSLAPGIVAAGMALKSWNENETYRRRANAAIPLGFLQPVESVADSMALT
jgi:NAD(P)-dependent dehydrogenase (short-subunit alcohol dehydrogenase family)